MITKNSQRSFFQVIVVINKLLLTIEMDEYHISDIPQRFIMAQHYSSSLEQPNLQNVEAILTATRRRNHDLAQEYFRSKYGSTEPYDEFTKHHNMGEPIPSSPPTPEQLLREHLSRKAHQIEKGFYGEQSPTNENHPLSKQLEWIGKAHPKSKTPNPWVVKTKDVDDQRKNGAVRPSSGVVENARNKQSEFISDFKNYLDKKQKQQAPSHQTQLIKTNNTKFEQSSKLTNKPKTTEAPSEKKRRCYEEELAKKIFKEIAGECREETAVEKLKVFQYMVQNYKILKVLGLSQQQLNEQLMGGELHSAISLPDFTYFLLRVVGKEQEIQQLKSHRLHPNVHGDANTGCMLGQEVLAHFQGVFAQLDTHQDMIIRRLPFIEALANDPFVRGFLGAPALYEGQLQKTIPLRRVFERIEMECVFGDPEQQRAKQYISWNEFLDYFKAGTGNPTLYSIINLIESLHSSETLGLSYVPDAVIKIIVEVAEVHPLKSGYFNTAGLIESIVKHPNYEIERHTQVRQSSKKSQLSEQTLQQVLSRIKKQGDSYMNLKEFLQYFSNTGRPIESFEEVRNELEKKNFSGVKRREQNDEVVERKEQLDGYDSDPEMYHSKLSNKQVKRNGHSGDKLEQSSSFVEGSQKKQLIGKRDFKVTIPEPFSFDNRERERERERQKMNASLDEQRKEERSFKAKAIPAAVLDDGLYERMMEQEKRKIEERKKCSMIMTLANQQPFSFMSRKVTKKSKAQRQNFIFKAKPIPWFCSVDLLDKKKEAEIARNEKIAKEAQESLSKAKLPPRMQRDFQQKLAKMAMDVEQQRVKENEVKPKMYREPPDFQKLHREFEEGLQRKRKENKPTNPQQFNFTQKNQLRSKTVNNYKTEQESSPKKEQYKPSGEGRQVAHSTVKYEQQVEKRRQEMDKKRKEEELRRVEECERQRIDENLKNKLVAATKVKREKSEQIAKEKNHKEMEQQMKNFQEWKKNCIEKGRQQPMLIERPLKRDLKIQKMRKLYQISQTLKGNGIRGRDHDSYFNKEELLLLQDWELVKDKL